MARIVQRLLRFGSGLALALAALASAALPAIAQQAGEAEIPGPPADANLPEVEPVISDRAFEDAIPELKDSDDPELARPLETLEEFERRLAAEQADARPGQGAAPPLGKPELSDGQASEEIGDAPISDPELARPLEPLDQFEFAPVQLADGADDSQTVEVPYVIRIEGLEAAEKESKVNLRRMFRSLSALRAGDGKAANLAMISARLTEDAELMRTVLASQGWYTPSVETRVDQPDEARPGPVTAVFEVVPGKRYSLSEIVIDAQPTVPPGLIRDNLALNPGEPIVAERVQGAEAQVSVALPQNGYPFVELGQRDILLDRATGKGVYTLPVETGPRSRFGEFATEGDLAFGAEHIAVMARFKKGELYDSRKVDDLRKALIATSLFATVSVEPRRSGEPAGEGSEFATVFVRQDAGPPRTIAGTAGYGTGEGFRVEASWTHRNLFPPEGALIVHGVAGTSEQGGGVTFRRSNAGKRDRTFELAAEALHSQFDAYSAYTGRLAVQWRYDSTPIWQKKFTYAFGGEWLATAEKDFDFNLGKRNRRTYYVGALNGQAGLDYTDDLLDPTRGFRFTALVQPEAALDGGFNPYVRARIDGSGYISLGSDLVAAGRVRVGTIQGAGLFDIPPSRRFYAGGGGSVRGFGYQQLGPLDPLGDPIGGRSLNEASAEVRYRFGTFGVVGFVDAGQSYADTLPRFSDLRFGAGIGGRYYTNFGPLRIDIATPIDRRPGESRVNIYVSIGQAF